MRKTAYQRRETLKLSGLAAVLALLAGKARAADETLPKGPKIGPPPEHAKGEDENGAEEDLHASEMIGLQLRVIKPGQAVTQEYNDGRLTVTLDKNNAITDIRVG